jgi:hypothetical protein
MATARPMVLVPQSKFRLMEERISTITSANTPDTTSPAASIQDGGGDDAEKDRTDTRSSVNAVVDSGSMATKEDDAESRPVFEGMDTDSDTDSEDDEDNINTTEELRTQSEDRGRARSTGPPGNRVPKRKIDTEHADAPPSKRRWLEY